MAQVMGVTIKVRIIYDKTLQKITKTEQETSIVNKGIVFIYLLYFIFQSYPEIEEKYPPGKLIILVNDIPVTDEYYLLKNGDVVKLSSIDNMTNLS